MEYFIKNNIRNLNIYYSSILYYFSHFNILYYAEDLSMESCQLPARKQPDNLEPLVFLKFAERNAIYNR